MKNVAAQSKNTVDKTKETLEGEYDMRKLSKDLLKIMEQIENLSNDRPPAPDVYRWMSVGAEERLLIKLKDVGSKLEFYTLTSEERNAADVLASTGEVKVYRNNCGNLELQYNEPNVFEKLISNSMFNTKSA